MILTWRRAISIADCSDGSESSEMVFSVDSTNPQVGQRTGKTKCGKEPEHKDKLTDQLLTVWATRGQEQTPQWSQSWAANAER